LSFSRAGKVPCQCQEGTGTKNLAVPSILKCQTGLGKAAEISSFLADSRWRRGWGKTRPEDRQKSSTKLSRLWVGRCPGVSLWAAFWGHGVGQRAFPEHREGDGHRTRPEVKGKGHEKTWEDAEIHGWSGSGK